MGTSSADYDPACGDGVRGHISAGEDEDEDRRMTPPPIIYTVGHSTRSLDEIAQLLRTHEVRCLADVRRYSASRRQPHVSAEALAAALTQQDIGASLPRHVEHMALATPDSYAVRSCAHAVTV